MSTELSLLSGARQPGAGYYNANNSQTIAATLADFSGYIRVYASLDTDPADDDSTAWVLVHDENYYHITNQLAVPLTGNYTWLRAEVDTIHGTVSALTAVY